MQLDSDVEAQAGGDERLTARESWEGFKEFAEVMRKGGRFMDSKKLNGASWSCSILGNIFSYLDNPADRAAVSRVCKLWKEVDSNTRKHVQIANCYSIAPAALSRRFPNLKSLKIKGQPRALEFGLTPGNWGGYAGPWIAEVTRAYASKFESLWLRRMQVTDEDLLLLAQSCPDLLTLKFEKCSGFSPVGLAYIAAHCR
jgi:coronatine-insensitive protein 1